MKIQSALFFYESPQENSDRIGNDHSPRCCCRFLYARQCGNHSENDHQRKILSPKKASKPKNEVFFSV